MSGVYSTAFAGDGTFSTLVRGTLHSQRALAVVRRVTSSRGELKFGVVLESEDGNPHDVNAVCVRFSGVKIGYLPAVIAAELRKWLCENGYHSVRAECTAVIVGGPRQSDSTVIDDVEAFNYGVRLDFAMPGSVSAASGVDSEGDTFFFAPMLSAPVVDGKLLSDIEIIRLEVGDWVRIWHPDGDTSRLFLYVKDGGRLGFVPDPYRLMCVKHLSAGLEIDAFIHQVDGGNVLVECRLVSRLEAERRESAAQAYQVERRRKRVEELRKKKVPRSDGFFFTCQGVASDGSDGCDAFKGKRIPRYSV